MGFERACSSFFFLHHKDVCRSGLQVFFWVDFFVFVYKLCAVDSISVVACN